MKILRKATIIFILLTEIIFILSHKTQINAFASTNLHTNNRNIVNIAVLLSSFDDLFMQQLKQDLEDIEKENKNKVRFTFYDGKNNIAMQNETIDYILRSNFDLIIANLADAKESSVEEVILRVKQKDIPLVLSQISPEVVSKVSKYYDKVAFFLSDDRKAGISQGKILVNIWNTDKKALDKNNDDILQYVLLRGPTNNIGANVRTNYVISTINDAGIQTQQLALVNADWLKELAKNSIDSLFLKYDGRIEAIIANNDAMAIGAIEALQKYGYNKGDNSKNIAVVGMDGLPEAKDLVDKGIMTGTVIQESKAFAEALYKVGMNLVQNLNPIENTNYEIVKGSIMIPISYEEYVKK